MGNDNSWGDWMETIFVGWDQTWCDQLLLVIFEGFPQKIKKMKFGGPVSHFCWPLFKSTNPPPKKLTENPWVFFEGNFFGKPIGNDDAADETSPSCGWCVFELRKSLAPSSMDSWFHFCWVTGIGEEGFLQEISWVEDWEMQFEILPCWIFVFVFKNAFP